MTAKKPPKRTSDVTKQPRAKRTAPRKVAGPVKEVVATTGEMPAAPTRTRREQIADAVKEADALIKSAGGDKSARDVATRAEPASKAARDEKSEKQEKGAKASKGTKRSPSPSTTGTLPREAIETRIRELEAKLDRMMEAASQGSLPALPEDDDDESPFDFGPAMGVPTDRAGGGGGGARGEPAAEPATRSPDSRPSPDAPTSVAPATSRASAIPAAPVSSRAVGEPRSLSPEAEPTAFDTARELLSTNYYLRKWGRLGLRNRSEQVDDFGYDPVYETRVKPFLEFLYSKYFRVEASGIEHVPSEGRCLLVANHSGTLPFDGLMIRAAVKRGHPQAREVRWLAEDFIFHFPFIGSFTTRIGAVRACQENAERLLRQDALVAVFPEGMKGTGKLFRDRYRLQRFGRGGFVKLALRTRTPIIPVAVLGGEETQPLLARLDSLGKPLGFPYVPVTPTFPLLGPLGLAPAPTKWRIVFGEPIHFHDGPESAEDELLIGRLAEQVRGTIQEMVDELVRARRSVFFG